MKFKNFAILLFFISSLSAFGQVDTAANNNNAGASNPVIFRNKASNKNKPHGLVYEKEFSLGGKITTAGWGIFGDFTKNINVEKSRTYYFEMQFFKNQKEEKKTNEFSLSSLQFDSPKPFIYGKQNSFFALKTAYGNKYLLGNKAEKSGFEVNFNYAIGGSIGFIKPYYLNIFYVASDDVSIKTEKYNDENKQLFLDATSIYGAAGFIKGFGDISIVPGAFAKAGLNFDWATYDDFVKSLEVGLAADIYPKRIPIMILENNKPYFIYLYLTLQLGKKW